MRGAWIVWAAAVLALAAAPLRAQAEDTASACVRAAGGEESADWVRWACAGTDFDAAVRFAVSLPAAWEVGSPRDAGLQVWALNGRVQMSVAAQDQLHAPATQSDTLGFWMRATGIRLGREPELRDVDSFRRATQNPDKARRAVTRAQQRDTVLLAMAHGLSLSHEGQTVLASTAEVRPLAGAPAGWLAETTEQNGEAWRSASYVTVRDAVVFIATLRAPDEEFDAALPLWEQTMATLEMRTDRSAPATPP